MAATRWVLAYNSPYEIVGPPATISAAECGALVAWSAMCTTGLGRLAVGGCRRLALGHFGRQDLVGEHPLDQLLHVPADRRERHEVIGTLPVDAHAHHLPRPL